MHIRGVIPAVLLLTAGCLEAQGPVRVQLVTGGHDHDISFYRVFENCPDLKVNVNPHPIAYRNDLRKSADVLVLYDMTDVTDEKQRTNLRNFVEAGKGVVVLHHAILDNKDWPWWYEEVVGGRYLEKGSRFKHDINLDIQIAGDHPVVKGIQPFRIYDEGYADTWVSPKVKPLLKTKHPDSDELVGWISPYEKSRVVYIQLGHGREAHENPIYRKLVYQAILWSAGRLN